MPRHATMSDDELNLPGQPYVRATSSAVAVGDICEAVALPDPSDPTLYEAPDLAGGFALAARIVYALVVSVYEGYVVVVPITTADVVGNPEQFQALVESGQRTRWWMRLPPLQSNWSEDAIALLFMPQTLPEEAVATRRIAAMSEAAQAVVSRRLARALSDGD